LNKERLTYCWINYPGVFQPYACPGWPIR